MHRIDYISHVSIVAHELLYLFVTYTSVNLHWVYQAMGCFQTQKASSDCCSTPTQQFFSGENKLIFNEMMMRSALYYTNTCSWIFIVLAHWNNSQRFDMSPHSDTLFWFWANQSLIFPLNAASLVKKQQIPILQSLVWPDLGSNLRSTALKESTPTITPPMSLK
jgi:hypothetical protein